MMPWEDGSTVVVEHGADCLLKAATSSRFFRTELLQNLPHACFIFFLSFLLLTYLHFDLEETFFSSKWTLLCYLFYCASLNLWLFLDTLLNDLDSLHFLCDCDKIRTEHLCYRDNSCNAKKYWGLIKNNYNSCQNCLCSFSLDRIWAVT